MPTIALQVKGKVQGVWYRASTRNKAQELGLNGIVRNEPDGSVYIEASGPAQQLALLKSWCQTGPPHAKVVSVQVTPLAEKTFQSFSILR